MSLLSTRLLWWPNFTTLADANNWLDMVDVVWFDTAITYTAGDWLKLHQLIESFNARTGRHVKVIRRLAKYLVPDKLDTTFDQTWKNDIFAIDVGDEEEDKQKNPDGSPANIYGTPGPIISYFTAAASEVRAELPGVRVIANFNGTHVNSGTLPTYRKIIDGAALDMICSDSYPNANDQTNASGQHLYPDLIAEAVNGAALFRAAYPASTGKKVFAFVDTCNEMLFAPGAPGWSAGWKAVGSRAWTPTELLTINSKLATIGADGIAYFPQQRGGAVNDATNPALIPTLRTMAGLPANSPTSPTATNNSPLPAPAPDPIVSVTVLHASGKSDVIKP